MTIQAQLKAAHQLLMDRRSILTYDERQLSEAVARAIVKVDLCIHQLEFKL